MGDSIQFDKRISTEKREKLDKNIIRIIKGSVFAIVMTLVLLFIYAAVLTYTNVSEMTMVPVVVIISGISILIGSSISSLKIKKQGMLNGALVGLIYMVTIYLLSSMLLSGFSINVHAIMMITVGIVAGMIGGIIGVNL